MSTVIVSGPFDDLRSPQVRFLDAASRLGEVHVRLWSDQMISAITGQSPRFPATERLYLLGSLRYVKQAMLLPGETDPDLIPLDGAQLWAVSPDAAQDRQQDHARACEVEYRAIALEELSGFPLVTAEPGASGRKKVIVTGCFDWFHSGHVRFFEEVSALGDLIVVVGHDANVRLLKGPQHPLFGQDERRYMVQAIRFVSQALISTGQGWMDAAPEIERLKPDIYAVNEDGDKPEKRAFCEQHGLEYVVLKRAPKEGLLRRQSTDLRGF
jgi:cytidyltransferase-like protein